jgi:hypothetical protein
MTPVQILTNQKIALCDVKRTKIIKLVKKGSSLNLSPKNEDKVQMIVDGFFQTLAVL